MAVISRRKWDKSTISNEFKKYFKGKIIFCPYKKNKLNIKKGNGYLINKKNKKIMPDIILRVAAGRLIAQEKAGIKVFKDLLTNRKKLVTMAKCSIRREETSAQDLIVESITKLNVGRPCGAIRSN